MSEQKPTPGLGGERYLPYAERTGGESVGYFPRDLSGQGPQRTYGRVE